MVKRAETRSDAGRRLAASSPLPQPGEHVGGIGFEAGPETLRREFFCDGDRAGRGIECVECRFSRISHYVALVLDGDLAVDFGHTDAVGPVHVYDARITGTRPFSDRLRKVIGQREIDRGTNSCYV